MYSSHTQAYGQPFGGQPQYPSAAQVHNYYLPPPPPPIPQQSYYADPNSFRKNYSQQLATLTINSRPIIQSLSILAQEFSRYADIVVSCVEHHIRKVPPHMKLPAFYLLDAISKNVHVPYARAFANVVAPLFLQAYSQVDQQTRQKMEEMLLTWRTGSPAGSELFGPVTQLAIERGVWGDGRNDTITKSQVMSELHFVIGAKERAMQTNPYDTDAQRKLDVLYQLRKLVGETGVSQHELRQILGQLHELEKVSGAPPAPPPAAPQATWRPPPSHYPSHPRPSSSQQYPPPQPTAYPPNQFTSTPTPPIPVVVPPVPSSSNTPVLPNAAENIANILSSLQSAGVLSNPMSQVSNSPAVSSSSQPAAPGLVASREYYTAMLSQKNTLSSSEILRNKPNVASFIYDRLPSQCKQCGIRFPDGVYGKTLLDEHLDMHFAQNRKAAQNSGRGHARDWFVPIDDWIRDVHRTDVDQADTSTEPRKSPEELSQMYVLVPAGDEAKNVSCPICKEHMKSEFKEDDEEWIWRNAVLKDGKIYHATCHAEALSSTSNIAARLRTDVVGSSRDVTPDSVRATPPLPVVSKSPSPDCKTGIKRERDPSEETTGTPPMKKMALAAS